MKEFELAIMRLRNTQSPFEFLHQRAENILTAYRGQRISKDELQSGFADINDKFRKLVSIIQVTMPDLIFKNGSDLFNEI